MLKEYTSIKQNAEGFNVSVLSTYGSLKVIMNSQVHDFFNPNKESIKLIFIG